MSRFTVESPDTKGSYRWFARSKTVMEQADLPAIRWAFEGIQANNVAEIGSGPGVMIEHLINEGILVPPFNAYAMDPDMYELQVGRQDLMCFQTDMNFIHFINAKAEQVPLPDTSQDIVTCLNVIHLTNAEKTIAEIFRIAKPGATILITTAYDPVFGYLTEEGTEVHDLWGKPAKKAMFGLARQGYRLQRAERPEGYLAETLEAILRKDGRFEKIRSMRKRVELDKEAGIAIHTYNGYVENTFPGVDIEIAREALKKGTEEVYDKVPVMPRGYIFIAAEKTA